MPRGLCRRWWAYFHDHDRGGFYFTSESANDLVIRQKVASDSPLPSGNASAALALIKLGQLDLAGGILRVFARQIAEQGEGMSSLVQRALIESVNWQHRCAHHRGRGR